MSNSRTLDLIKAIVAKLGGTMTGINQSSVVDGLEQILALIGVGGGPAIGTAIGKDEYTQTLTDGANTVTHNNGAYPISVKVAASDESSPVYPDWTPVSNNAITINWVGGTLTDAKITLTF